MCRLQYRPQCQQGSVHTLLGEVDRFKLCCYAFITNAIRQIRWKLVSTFKVTLIIHIHDVLLFLRTTGFNSLCTNLSGLSSRMLLLFMSLMRPPGRRPRSVNEPASSGCVISATTCRHRQILCFRFSVVRLAFFCGYRL